MNEYRRCIYISSIYIEDIYTHTYINTHTHTHTMEYYSAIKKDKILTLATTWMDLDSITLSEISQTEKGKYCMLPLTCEI